jgi:hypothetical protein
MCQHGTLATARKRREAFFSLLDVLSRVMLAIAFCLTGGLSRVVVTAIGVQRLHADKTTLDLRP